MLDQVTENLPSDQYLIINAGNSFDRNSPYTGIAAKYIVRMLGLSGVDVIGIGPTELLLGAGNLKKLLSRSAVEMVSANVPGFLPYIRFNKCGGRCKVLVTSVIDPGVLKTLTVKFKPVPTDPVAAIRKIEKEVDHDLFIVIIHAMDKRIAEIANSCPGIDLVIDGLTHGITKKIDKKTVMPLVMSNRRGQYVSYLDYRPDMKPEFTQPVNLWVSREKTAEDLQIKKLAEKYDKEKNEYGRKLREERLRQKMMKKTPNLYLGYHACESCHPDNVASWRKTRHADALATLVRKGKEHDVECIRCHVTGMDDHDVIGGFSSFEENPWMVNVQCESCHGPGANHVQQPHKNRMKVGRQMDCRHCHTYTTDPGFDFDKKVKIIEHKAVQSTKP